MKIPISYTCFSVSGPNGFSLFAQKSEKISTFDEIIVVKGEDFEDIEDEYEFDDDEYDFDDDEDDFDDDEEEEDDELMVPFDKMNAWLEKRPKGFGEGKFMILHLRINYWKRLSKV